MTQSVKSPICPLLCLSAAACLLCAVTLSCSPVFESGHCCHCASAEQPRRHCCGVELSQPTVLQATSKKREHLSPRGDVYLSKVSNNEENTHSHRRNHAHPHCVWTQLTLWFCCFHLTFISVLTISQCGLIQQINTTSEGTPAPTSASACETYLNMCTVLVRRWILFLGWFPVHCWIHRKNFYRRKKMKTPSLQLNASDHLSPKKQFLSGCL